MIHVINFYEADDTNPEHAIPNGSVVIHDRGEYRIIDTGMPPIMKEELNEVLRDGILSYDKSRQLFPRDGQDFIERLLGRYSGSLCWARVSEQPE